MQKPRTFLEAYNEHIIDNNIDLTLKTLFKPNNLFYINKNPYTIVGLKSNSNDWQIDKKPIDQLLHQFSELTITQIEEAANKEQNAIPEIIRQGNASSANLTEEENITHIENVLKDMNNNKAIKIVKDDVSGLTKEFINYEKLLGTNNNVFSDIFSKYLRKNNPINYSNQQDLANDPLTMSLLIDPNDLLTFIKKQKNKTLIELYTAYIKTKLKQTRQMELKNNFHIFFWIQLFSIYTAK